MNSERAFNTLVVVGASMGPVGAVAIRIAHSRRPIVRIELERRIDYLKQPWDLIRSSTSPRPFLSWSMSWRPKTTLPSGPNWMLSVQRSQTILDPYLWGCRQADGQGLSSERPSITITTGKTQLKREKKPGLRPWNIADGTPRRLANRRAFLLHLWDDHDRSRKPARRPATASPTWTNYGRLPEKALDLNSEDSPSTLCRALTWKI